MRLNTTFGLLFSTFFMAFAVVTAHADESQTGSGGSSGLGTTQDGGQ